MNNKKRKYYFKDYTKQINLSKKIKEFLFKYKDINSEFHYKELGKFLKKNLYKQPMIRKDKDGKIIYFKSSLIIEELLFQIQKGFDILVELGYLKSFEFEHLPKQDSYIIVVDFTNDTREFDELLKDSIYYPIKGEKQKITDELRKLINTEYFIDYEKIAQNCSSTDYTEYSKNLQDILVDTWNSQYIKMTKVDTYIHKVNSEFTFLFDVQSYSYEEDFVEDRIVVTYGLSKKSEIKRDTSRLSGYLRDAWNWTDKDTDKGHFIGHSLGGNLDENIFPQKKDINRGHSKRGKVYRKMEQYCADNEGIFCFSRPIYCDFSTRPFVLEYGVLKQDGSLWVEWFDNL